MTRILSFVLTLIAVVSVAQSQPLRPGEWRTYTSMRNVRDVAVSEDSQFVWAATSGGAFRVRLLDRTDILELRNTDGLSENDLTAVAADKNGNVYFGGLSGSFDIWQKGSGRIRRERSIMDAPEFGLKSVNDIFPIGQRVYIATGYGLTIYDLNRNAFGETVIAFGGLAAQLPVRRVIVHRDTIYAVLERSVAFTPASTFNLNNPSVWTTITAGTSTLLSVSVVNDRVIVGSSDGLYTVNASAQTLDLLPSFAGVSATDLQASNGTLYVLDATGEYRLITTTDLVATTSVSIPREDVGSNRINALAIGRQGLAIAGSTTTGLLISIASGEQVEGVFPAGPTSNSVVDAAFAGRIDRLITAHGSAGLSLFDPDLNSWLEYPARDTRIQPGSNHRRITYDSIRNVTWVGLNGGGVLKISGLELNSPQWKRYGKEEGLSSSVPADDGFIVSGRGLVDAAGDFWTTNWSFNGRGLARYVEEQDRFSAVSLPGGHYSYAVVAEDLNRNLWVGTERNEVPSAFGLFYRTSDNRTGSIFGGGTGVLSARAVNAVLVDQNNALWAGTDAGLDIIADIYKVSQANPNFTARRSVPFLEGQAVRAMATDGVGNKWIGTENGIFVVSEDGTDSVARFNTENSPLIDNVIRSITIDMVRGEAYIGTEKGLSRVSTIFKQGASDYTGIKVYPNPVVQTVEVQPTVYISGLVGGSYVGIYSMSGRLVASVDGKDLGGIITWDGRDGNGNLLPSGVYLVSATSLESADRGQAKIVIIRKE
jgi:ligand-binding sensor domain-containing protein